LLLLPRFASAQATTNVAVTAPSRSLLANKPETAPPLPAPPPPAAASPAFETDIPFVPRSAGAEVSLSLEDADLEELVRTMSQLSGKRFVVATNKAKGFKATVYSPQKISVAEAYKTFLAILQANGLTVLPDGPLLKIVDTQDVTRQPTPVSRHGEPLTTEERYVTRVHRLEHVLAEDVTAAVLSKLESRDGTIVPYAPGNLLIITDTGRNIERMLRILSDIDVGGAKEQVWLEPVFYSPSSALQKELADILDLTTKDAKPGASAEPGASAAHIAKIVAVDRPNALAIVGTERGYHRALDLIKRMDVPASSEGEIHVVSLQYADAKKIAPALTQALSGAGGASGMGGGGTSPPGGAAVTGSAAVLEAPVKISPEETTNSLIIASSPRDYAAIREVVSKLDQPHRQVYIEAVVLDVSMNRTNELGLQYHGAGAASAGALAYGGLNALASIQGPAGADASTLQGLALGVQGPSTGLTLPGLSGTGISIPAFGMLLTAMATDSDTDILSTPHILASDNTPAEIKVQLHTSMQKNAQSFSLASASSPLSGASPAIASTPQYATLGPRIKITPHVNDSDDVRLDIEEQISDAGVVDSGSLGTLSYNERDATTTLTVKDQQTVVIGGLVRDNVTHTATKIPILGDIPLLGMLFRSTTDNVVKQNLVLILTPYIIRDQDDLRRIFERKMEERQDFIDHTALFTSHVYDPPRDYVRAEGLLGCVRKEYRQVAARQAIERLRAPRELQTHDGVPAIDLPEPSLASPHAATPEPSRPASPAVVRVER
jgi:general secretion pathway protein D